MLKRQRAKGLRMSSANTALETLYENHLKEIEGIRFTRRQIDIIACLLSGWSQKRIASYLSIETSTVQSHLNTLAQKLGSGGKNRILIFVEQSGKEKKVREYYEILLNQNFKKNQSEHILNEVLSPLASTTHKFKIPLFSQKKIYILSISLFFIFFSFLCLRNFHS